MIGVTEHVAGTVHTRTLAIPNAKHAVIFALAPPFRLLRAPQRRRRQVFI